MTAIKPIYLFADSQLLFWKEEDTLFLNSLKVHLPEKPIKAAYIGASNGDEPTFYHLFKGAMEGIGITDCRMILSSFSEEDRQFVEEADLILLAGGDVEQGWEVFQKVGLDELIPKKYYDGTLFIGISAGAIQLGLSGFISKPAMVDHLLDTFKIIPFLIGAHESQEDWLPLKTAVGLAGPHAKGLGIPSGGGMIYHSDHTVEPIRHPLSEFFMKDGQLQSSLVFPGEGEQEDAE